MCGVFGVISGTDCGLLPKDLRILTERLYRVSESRGKEAAGICLATSADPGVLRVQKGPVRGRELLREPETRSILARARRDLGSGEALALLGHTRMVTNGDPSDPGNNQPVMGDRTAVIHNGIVTNDEDLWRSHPTLVRRHTVDTEIIVRLIEDGLDRGQELAAAAATAASAISGANTFAAVDRLSGGIIVVTANGSLYCASTPDERLTVFASEEPILRRALANRRLRRLGLGDIVAVRAGSGFVIPNLDGMRRSLPVAFGDGATRAQRPPVAATPPRVSSLDRLVRVNEREIRELRRCRSCILPESFPGLTFDVRGVCSVCRSYRAPQATGLEALRTLVPPGARVLVPLSGGRDSSYGLHVAARELDVTMIAFTYDWGMVTDLARRNISRMCGALGVEHVLVSADIARKRSHVRRNILAWLRRPELGTIPLFMAGDKQFFYHAQRLRREHACDLVVFSHNPYERTDFKSGFAGVRDAEQQKRVYYDLGATDKLRLAAYYAKQAVLNPAYLNASLVDSISGYLSYYLIPKQYVSLYDHVPWVEREIDRTLLDEYDWETSPDTPTTWRIGDGTAPFYNYLYLRLAGFTENDALRSNQVRAGHLTRDEALSLALAENRPRTPSLVWYLDTLGLNAEDVILRVNRIPTRFAA